MKADKSKLLLEINGRTVIERTVDTFSKIKDISEIIVVCREGDLDAFEKVLSKYELSYCFGGDTRQQSMMNALETIDECDYLVIHDGARPLVTEKEIGDTLKKAYETDASAVGVPVKDTIKVINSKLEIVDTPERSTLVAIQTPQIFKFDTYVKASELAREQGKDYTDDCRLVENYGKTVSVVIGEYSNIKITTPEDIPMAQSILSLRGEKKMRIGHGYDVHRLVEGRRCIIGGVEIESELGLLGHSDADVLLHAVSDAILGACAMGDIGHLFPDTDDKWKGADSLKLLEEVVRQVNERGYIIVNIDSTILAQAPKMAPHINAMRENIARVCGIDVDCVSVKATTEEGLGFTGSREGISAHAVCLIEKK